MDKCVVAFIRRGLCPAVDCGTLIDLIDIVPSRQTRHKILCETLEKQRMSKFQIAAHRLSELATVV